jgi:hypothetical protein
MSKLRKTDTGLSVWAALYLRKIVPNNKRDGPQTVSFWRDPIA